MNYDEFLQVKSQLGGDHGFAPTNLPSQLFPFQASLIDWSLRKGRSAIFADCGLGKTLMQLVWADNVVRHTNMPVLILTPLAVSFQTVAEAAKFGIDAVRSSDGADCGTRIVVTNYERLHLFEPTKYSGLVCDESSILKHYTGATQKGVTRFTSKIPFRLLATATAAPNDYVELGTSSEALGGLSHSDMLRRFFRQCDNKRQDKEARDQEFAEVAHDHFKKLSFRVSQSIGEWRLKHHAVRDFWRWVASWARACRMPSDLGFSDDGFVLPQLTEEVHVVTPNAPPAGMLFNVPAFGLSEEREERRRTMTERCEMAARLADHDRPAVVWCDLNNEGNELERMIPGSRQIAGSTPDDEKEEISSEFIKGNIRVLVTKAKIFGFGVNWQHCAHSVTFASHSYEKYYQSTRRFWRFGQKNPVKVDVVATLGESRVVENMRRKANQSATMFAYLVAEMNNATSIHRTNDYQTKEAKPSWL